MKILKVIAVSLTALMLQTFSYAQNPVGARSSDRANEVATNTEKPKIEYVNASKEGERVLVSAGEIKLLLVGPHENFYRELKKD